MNFIQKMWLKAYEKQMRIVLPEGNEPRTLQAAEEAIEHNLAEIILIGNPIEINESIERMGLKNVKEKATIIDPENHPKLEEYANLIFELRKHKGVTIEKALTLIKNPLYLGVTMIKAGDADGEVAGAINKTDDVIRPAFQIVKTFPGVSVVSGVFVMVFRDLEFGENGLMLFADCGVNPDPDERMLAEIAISTAETAKGLLDFEPRIAMLSFSTHGSAQHSVVDKVANAVRRTKEMRPELVIDGDIQLDAAIVPEVAAIKCPDSPLGGKANILIFPSLEAGNIGYKLVQRFAHADAYGPILQGLAAPINDLSRGCTSKDIVNVIAITACQALHSKQIKE
jgi:phosphate acetyltransferase